MFQFMLTPAAGKRLIGKAMTVHPAIKSALKNGTIVIVGGTTNGYVAEEILGSIDQMSNFSRKRFFRGITLPPDYKTTTQGRLPDESGFKGDVVIKNGILQQNKTIEEVADSLSENDVILKGANALDITRKEAAILVGNPAGGTIFYALKAAVGRRARLIIPVGLEKRITGNLYELAAKINAPGSKGLRLLPAPGEVFTEIEAISLLANVNAELVAAGGISGAEGSVWLAVAGSYEAEQKAEVVLQSVAGEAGFVV